MRPTEKAARERYIESLFGIEDEALRTVRERLASAGKTGIHVGAGEGRTLQTLVRACQARKALEIGALFGYSTVWIARGLAPGGRLFTIERDAAHAREARQSLAACGVSDRVTLLEGEAFAHLPTLEREAPFDFVFIDGAKGAYADQFSWAKRHVREGGLIVLDNTLLGGALVGEATTAGEKQCDRMHAFNLEIAADAEVVSTLLPTSEGLTVAVKL